MKFTSSQFVKAAFVCGGLFVVLLAYRASDDRSDGLVDLDAHLSQGISLRSNSDEIAIASATSAPPLEIAPLGQTERPEDLEPAVDVDRAALSSLESRLAPAPGLTLEESTAESVDAEASLEVADPIDFAQSAELIETEFQETDSTRAAEFAQPVAAPTSALKPLPQPVPGSPALADAAAQKAVHHIEYGKSLARRNATEAASQEFVGALRVLAESNDNAVGGNSYTGALRSGLLAIKEAEDFKIDDPQRQLILNVANVIQGHETQIIGADEAQRITSSAASRRYLEYAGQMLGSCGGQNAVAAEALYCLGKLRSITAQADPDPESKELMESIIFHHASLTADPLNHRSANELGVLLARSGQLDAAEIYLKNSLKIRQTPQAWSNLAKVHHRKGTPEDQHLASLAFHEFQVAMQQETSGAVAGPIQWVDPQQFEARSPAQSPEVNEAVVETAPVVQATNLESQSDPTLVERIGSLFSPKNRP